MGKRIILPCLLAALVSCTNVPVNQTTKGIARITFYNKHEDKYGSRIASSKIQRACVGRTIAAESRSFPFGTKINIPGLSNIVGNGTYVVEDRGTDVEKRKASYGTTPVFDIFAGTVRQMKQWVREVPAYLEYEIQ